MPSKPDKTPLKLGPELKTSVMKMKETWKRLNSKEKN